MSCRPSWPGVKASQYFFCIRLHERCTIIFIFASLHAMQCLISNDFKISSLLLVLKNRLWYVEVLTPGSSEVTSFGDRVFKEVIKMRSFVRALIWCNWHLYKKRKLRTRHIQRVEHVKTQEKVGYLQAWNRLFLYGPP